MDDPSALMSYKKRTILTSWRERGAPFCLSRRSWKFLMIFPGGNFSFLSTKVFESGNMRDIWTASSNGPESEKRWIRDGMCYRSIGEIGQSSGRVFLTVAILPGWILKLLLFVTDISIVLSNVQALYNNITVTILILSGPPLFDSYEPAISWSQWKSESYVLMILINQLIIMNSPYIVSNLQVHLKYLQCCPHSLGLQLVVTLITRLYHFHFSMMDFSGIWYVDPWICTYLLYHLNYQPLTSSGSL